MDTDIAVAVVVAWELEALRPELDRRGRCRPKVLALVGCLGVGTLGTDVADVACNWRRRAADTNVRSM